MEIKKLMEQEQQSLEIKKYVKANTVRLNTKVTRCGDGRPEKTDEDKTIHEGALKVFGADFGVVMAFAGALKDIGENIESDEIVDRYYRAKRKLFGEDTRLDYHTDSHSQYTGEKGCGHAKKASDSSNDGAYGKLTSIEADKLFNVLTKHPQGRISVLNGEHKEKGVLFISSTEEANEPSFTVKPSDENGNMFFVVDQQAISKYVEKISEGFSDGLLKHVYPNEALKNLVTQMNSTAHLLAKDLPMYKVGISKDKNVTVSYWGKVE